MKIENKLFSLALILLLAAFVLASCDTGIVVEPTKTGEIARFSSGEELVNAFEEARERNQGGFYDGIMESIGVVKSMAETTAVPSAVADGGDSSRDFSDTNIQVQGVDEADIIKTDGNYIYTLAQGNLVIVKAYPADEAEIL